MKKPFRRRRHCLSAAVVHDAAVRHTLPICCWALLLAAPLWAAVASRTTAATAAGAEQIVVLPGDIQLTGPLAKQTLLVERRIDGENRGESPQTVIWTSSAEQIVRVVDGLAVPSGNGQTTLTASAGKQTASARVTVRGMDQPSGWEFRRHVIPVLSKIGCNAGACHGALAGKGGFKLSLNGYNPIGDYDAITRQARGRRIELSDPGRSLLLAKPSGVVAHRGGLKLDPESENYQILAAWIVAGAAAPTDEDAVLEHIEVLPTKVLLHPGASQRLIVRAFYSDGRVEDVTRWARFTSTESSVAQVDAGGHVTVVGRGEGSIVVWFSSQIVLARVTSPYTHPDRPREAANWPKRNWIDQRVNEKLRQLNLAASPRCDDSTFVRRVSIDTIGTLPTVEETVAFLADKSPDKRDQLIETLLQRQEFVDYWSYRWSDVLLINGNRLRPAAVQAYYQWIRKHVAQNTPWDQIVRELVLASGSNLQHGAANFYTLHASPEEMSENVCQAFLGLSIGCAKCHNHPLEKWTNDQYYAMANLFARVRGKGWGGERRGNGERTLLVARHGELIQPRTGRPQPPAPLDGQPLAFDDPGDRRIALADWLTAPENPYFTRAIVNRVWQAYFGVGLVEPVDDLRVSNPASNQRLLDQLSRFLVQHHYDLQALMRLILQSETYQRTSRPLAANAEDRRFYSRYYPRRLMAEVLLDAISQVTDVPTPFNKIVYDGADLEDTKVYPLGTRAIQLRDAAVQSRFLTMFGRNPRDIVCACQRTRQPSMVQVLNINNGDTILRKLHDEKSRVGQWLESNASAEQIIEDAYLRAFSRRPTEQEQHGLLQVLAEADRANAGPEQRRAIREDLLWSLLSSREFLFQH